MKIGILTQPLRLNFGGLLQNFALQYVLKKMGHEVDTIDKDYRRELPPLTKRLLIYLKRFIKRYVLNQKKVMIRFEAEFNKSYPVMSQYTQRFIDKYISVKTVDHFRNVSEGYYDAFIAGSDQVWRGGPHVGLNYIWPMSIIMKAFTTDDSEEIRACLKQLRDTDGGTGFMHESFHSEDAADFTRSWFAWTNTLFGELILNTIKEYPNLLSQIL